MWGKIQILGLISILLLSTESCMRKHLNPPREPEEKKTETVTTVKGPFTVKAYGIGKFQGFGLSENSQPIDGGFNRVTVCNQDKPKQCTPINPSLFYDTSNPIPYPSWGSSEVMVMHCPQLLDADNCTTVYQAPLLTTPSSSKTLNSHLLSFDTLDREKTLNCQTLYQTLQNYAHHPSTDAQTQSNLALLLQLNWSGICQLVSSEEFTALTSSPTQSLQLADTQQQQQQQQHPLSQAMTQVTNSALKPQTAAVQNTNTHNQQAKTLIAIGIPLVLAGLLAYYLVQQSKEENAEVIKNLTALNQTLEQRKQDLLAKLHSLPEIEVPQPLREPVPLSASARKDLQQQLDNVQHAQDLTQNALLEEANKLSALQHMEQDFNGLFIQDQSGARILPDNIETRSKLAQIFQTFSHQSNLNSLNEILEHQDRINVLQTLLPQNLQSIEADAHEENIRYESRISVIDHMRNPTKYASPAEISVQSELRDSYKNSYKNAIAQKIKLLQIANEVNTKGVFMPEKLVTPYTKASNIGKFQVLVLDPPTSPVPTIFKSATKLDFRVNGAQGPYDPQVDFLGYVGYDYRAPNGVLHPFEVSYKGSTYSDYHYPTYNIFPQDSEEYTLVKSLVESLQNQEYLVNSVIGTKYAMEDRPAYAAWQIPFDEMETRVDQLLDSSQAQNKQARENMREFVIGELISENETLHLNSIAAFEQRKANVLDHFQNAIQDELAMIEQQRDFFHTTAAQQKQKIQAKIDAISHEAAAHSSSLAVLNEQIVQTTGPSSEEIADHEMNQEMYQSQLQARERQIKSLNSQLSSLEKQKKAIPGEESNTGGMFAAIVLGGTGTIMTAAGFGQLNLEDANRTEMLEEIGKSISAILDLEAKKKALVKTILDEDLK